MSELFLESNYTTTREQFSQRGFSIVDNIYTVYEVECIAEAISRADTSNTSFLKTDDLFAIRQFLKEIPSVKDLVFTSGFKSLIESVFGHDYFVVKSIYFDKAEKSNWFVAWHQDLTISVDKRTDLPGFGPWTVKKNQFAVQPPIEFLQKNFTIRIHLDDTTHENGALRVIPQSHKKGIFRSENIDWTQKEEELCAVQKGGVMLMHPLLFHASGKSSSESRRRVIHLEFSNKQLPEELRWSEKEYF